MCPCTLGQLPLMTTPHFVTRKGRVSYNTHHTPSTLALVMSHQLMAENVWPAAFADFDLSLPDGLHCAVDLLKVLFICILGLRKVTPIKLNEQPSQGSSVSQQACRRGRIACCLQIIEPAGWLAWQAGCA